MSANATTAAPTGRKKLAQGKERSDAALGNDSQNTSSPEGAKELLNQILDERRKAWRGRGKYSEPVSPKTDELPALPKRWTWASIEQLTSLVATGATPYRGKSAYWKGGTIPWVTSGALNDVTVDVAKEFVTPLALEETNAKLFPSGTLLVALYGEGKTRGMVSELRIDAATNQACAALLFNDFNSPLRPYVRLYLQKNYEDIRRLSSGGVQPNLSLSIVKHTAIPLAPLPEQRRIVAEIEKQFTRLEAGVVALRRVQANLKRYRAAVLKAACEGKLVPTEHELSKSEVRIKKDEAKSPKSRASTSSFLTPTSSLYESGEALLQRILAERRKNWTGRGKYKEPAAPDTANLPPLPVGWTYASVESVGFVQLGRQRAPQHHKGANMRPYLRVANVFEDRIDLSDVMEMNFTPEEFKTFQLKPNDILLNEGQSLELVGRPAIYKGELPGACFTNTLVRFRPCGSLDVKFALSVFRAFMHSGRFQKIAKWTTNIAHLGSDRFAKMAFPLPPLAEQTRIVAEVERRLSVVEELESVVSANLQRATRLRQSILQKAFTGQLVAQEDEIKPAKIIELPKSPMRPPNRHFARALLSAEIVHRLHNEPTFGRIKHQKIFHLCEHIAQIKEIEGQYHREVAGPLDNKLIYANEAELKKQKWYQEVHRSSYGHAYEPMAKAGAHRKYVEGYWPDRLPIIEKLIELMRTWDTDRCEIFCTAYAAWNDLLLWGKEPTEAAILHEILNRWHESKRRFSEERWRKAIGWMREKGFVPTGFGRLTAANLKTSEYGKWNSEYRDSE